jgi:hypothetical protein
MDHRRFGQEISIIRYGVPRIREFGIKAVMRSEAILQVNHFKRWYFHVKKHGLIVDAAPLTDSSSKHQVPGGLL